MGVYLKLFSVGCDSVGFVGRKRGRGERRSSKSQPQAEKQSCFLQGSSPAFPSLSLSLSLSSFFLILILILFFYYCTEIFHVLFQYQINSC